VLHAKKANAVHGIFNAVHVCALLQDAGGGDGVDVRAYGSLRLPCTPSGVNVRPVSSRLTTVLASAAYLNVIASPLPEPNTVKKYTRAPA
jgi:hypothetical protein